MSFDDVLLAAAKESAVERYQNDETIASIARSFGVKRERIYKWLIEHDAYTPAPTPGARPQVRCQRGHDMGEWGRPLRKGGRYCLLCKRERDRESWRRRQGPA